MCGFVGKYKCAQGFCVVEQMPETTKRADPGDYSKKRNIDYIWVRKLMLLKTPKMESKAGFASDLIGHEFSVIINNMQITIYVGGKYIKRKFSHMGGY